MPPPNPPAIPASAFLTPPSLPAYRAPAHPAPPRRARAPFACAPAPRPPAALVAAAARLAALPDAAARVRALLTREARFARLAEGECGAETRVAGCASVTHILVWLEEGEGDGAVRVRLAGRSDARVAEGLVGLLVEGCDGAGVEEVLAVRVGELVGLADLKVGVRVSRAGGLASMVKAVQDRVGRLVEERERGRLGRGDGGVGGGDGKVGEFRWSSVQAEDVAVLLSGGVDSSVALRLVQDAGYRPHPFYLKIWLEDELAHLGECPWEEDIEFATAVCDQAGVGLETVSMQREYWDRVVAYTIAEARAGRTPNPDVMCNSRVKFGAFYDEIGRHFPRVVTGHYARKKVDSETGLAELCLSPDSVKDQTYFLAHLNQAQLARAEFPLGEFEKNRVRDLAMSYNLPNRMRKDSQGICFLGKLKFDDFLFHHLGAKPGPLVDFETGEVLGEHRGFWYYTMGQRRGIRLSGGPWYVTAKDAEANVVYVSRQFDRTSSARCSFDFESVSWLTGHWPRDFENGVQSVPLRVKVRHGPTMYPCEVERLTPHSGSVRLLSDSTSLAPGQFAVFYSDSDVCLGSGVISEDVHRRHRDAVQTLQRNLSPTVVENVIKGFSA